MSFQAIAPDGTQETTDANWRNYNQSVQSGTWNPLQAYTGSNYPTVTGTNVSTTAYYRTTADNICHFNVTWAVPTGTCTVAFTNGQYILLPTTFTTIAGAVGATNVSYPYCTAPLTTTAGLVGTLFLNNTTVNSINRGVAINNTGATLTATSQYVSIQGWFFVGK